MSFVMRGKYRRLRDVVCQGTVREVRYRIGSLLDRVVEAVYQRQLLRLSPERIYPPPCLQKPRPSLYSPWRNNALHHPFPSSHPPFPHQTLSLRQTPLLEHVETHTQSY